MRGNKLYLNNERLFLKGISRHDLYGDQSFVGSPETIEQDLTHIKHLGANYVRAIHYPPDERVARRADELGLLLSEEIPVWAEVEEPAVVDQAIDMFIKMVERDFNRPSVIIWYAGSRNRGDEPHYYTWMSTLSRALDPSRLVSFVFDAPVFEPADIQQLAHVARDGGFDFYAQNGCSFHWRDDTFMALPTDFPVVIGEWSGSECNDRGPIGQPGVEGFPQIADPWGLGIFPEVYQALTMIDRLNQWLPFVSCTEPSTPCVSGLTYFNWQDVPWPGYSLFAPRHNPAFYTGLVYDDRGHKAWPMAVFQWLMTTLPGFP